MVTNEEKTFCGFWKSTKENTYYGYKVTENSYEWFKTKKTVLKRVKGTNKAILRATLIGDEMYINYMYLTTKKW